MLEQYMGYGYLVVAAVVYAWVAVKSRAKAVAAGKAGVKAFSNVFVTLFSVFALVGLLNTFVPISYIESLLGAEGGVASLFTGAAVGSALAGPPVAAYPVAASLLDAGAWLPAVAALIISWTLVGFLSLPMEIQVLGARFAISRNVLSFVLAILMSLVMGWIL